MVQPKEQSRDGVRIGDVVTLQDRIDLMTVEGVRVGAFSVVLDCCWFDADDCLRFRSFPLTMLDLFPRPTPEGPIGVGTEVRLRSRGPVMTVKALRERGGDVLADCVWTGPMQSERRRLFPVDGLVLTMLERFEGLGGEEY